MKRILLIAIMLFSVLSVEIWSKSVTSVKDLKAGDSFSLKITVPVGKSEPSSVWSYDNVQKIDVEFIVLSVDKDSVRMAVRPFNWYICYPNLNYPDLLKREGVGVNNYLDFSYYGDYFDGKSRFFLFENNLVTASLANNTGEVSVNFPKQTDDPKSGRSAKMWYAQIFEIPKGLSMVHFDGTILDYTLNFDFIVKSALQSYFNRWTKNLKEGLSMPWLIDLSPDVKKNSESPAFIQLSSASFDLNPNTQIKLTVPVDIEEDRVFISNGDIKIKPVHKDGNTYQFDLFLSEPKRVYFENVILDLTPGDSLNVASINSEYKISGKGSINSIFTNAIVPLLYKGEKRSGDFFAQAESVFNTEFSKYESSMNEYWVKSAKLSFDYWYAAQKMIIYNENVMRDWGQRYHDESNIPWGDKHFTNLYPFTDYLYQPYNYGDLIQTFFDFKARQANNSILTGIRYLQGNIMKFYFADAIFWGYPRFYLTSEALKDQMIYFQLNESEREYKYFIERCSIPEFRTPVVDLHEKLLKVEPGANLKGLDLDVEKYLSIGNKSDEYIVLFVSDNLGNNPDDRFFEKRLSNFEDEIKKAKLEKKVKVYIVTGESQKSLFEKNNKIHQFLHFVPDKVIRDYRYKVASNPDAYIVMRNDGTIVDRWQNSKYIDSPHFLIRLIQDDMDTLKTKDSALSRVLPFVLIILAAVLVTFFLVRFFVKRQERVRRQLLELELKAIRAQMNPHFTFNALGSIQNLIAQDKRKEADEYLVNFAKLLRIVLNSSETRLIPLSDEIALISLYLHLEQLRVPFTYSIVVDENIETEIEEIPGMLIQPIVENAIKHGIVPYGGGNVIIDFSLKDQILYAQVTDTGSGFMPDIESKTKGFGLKSTRERLALLNKDLHLNIGIQIENVEQDGITKGCRVILSIPV